MESLSGVLFDLPIKMVMAILAGACMLAAIATYIQGIRAGRSLPYMWSWLIRCALCAVVFVAQLSEDATFSLALYAAQLLGAGCIVALIVKRQGSFGRLDRVDWSAIIIAGAGVVAWIASGNALFSVLGVVAADAVATGIGVRAAIVYKRRESVTFWGLALCAAALTLLTVANGPMVLVVAPLFSCVNAVVNIQVAWWLRQQQRRLDPVLTTS